MKPAAVALAVLFTLAAGLLVVGCGEGDGQGEAVSIEKCRQITAAGEGLQPVIDWPGGSCADKKRSSMPSSSE